MQFNRFDKAFIVFTAVFVAVMAGSGYYLQSSMKEKLTAHLKQDGLLIARTLSQALPKTVPAGGLDGFCSAYRDDLHLRITIIDPDGRVIGESHRSSAGMENHGDRPEIRQALETGSGWSLRHSATLNEDMFYTAVLTQDPTRVVRVAMPLAHLRQIESEIMLAASIFLYIVPFVAAGLLIFLARYLKKVTPAPR
jgi:two-component system phosphate regulon sensor histidine kinase PhoR